MSIRTWVLFIICIILHKTDCVKHRNNVCKTLESYFDIDKSPECYYEEDITLLASDVILKYTGNLEVYDMTTEDGYKLKMFRIPRKNPKGVLLLHHPLNTNANAYTFSGNKSLAISLWHSGYEVWINNHRGTNYSLGHTHLSALQYEYWNFSFHEIAIYDLVEEIKIIRKQTNNSQIIFYGYSMGADVGLVYASLFPKLAKEYFKVIILAGIPCYFEHSSGPTPIYGLTADVLKVLFEFLQLGTTLPLAQSLRYLAKYFIMRNPSYLIYNTEILNFVFGFTEEQDYPVNFPIDILHFVDSFSSKTMIHITQLIKEKSRFQMYDYGKRQNIQFYGSEKPPLYPLENVIVPTFLISGDEDIMTTSKDADKLFETIAPEARIYGQLKVHHVNHIDYIFGKHAKKHIYDNIIKFLDGICDEAGSCF